MGSPFSFENELSRMNSLVTECLIFLLYLKDLAVLEAITRLEQSSAFMKHLNIEVEDFKQADEWWKARHLHLVHLGVNFGSSRGERSSPAFFLRAQINKLSRINSVSIK